MDAPKPPDTVEPCRFSSPSDSSGHHSRSVPVVGVGEGVIHPACSGKYSQISGFLCPDFHSTCDSSSSIENWTLETANPANGTLCCEPAATALSCSLRIYYQNVRGLRTKVDNFFVAVAGCSYDVVVLVETWLDDRIHSAQLFGDSFAVFRNDRNPLNSSKKRGGGVLIAVSKRYSCHEVSTLVSTALEQLWVEIRLPNCKLSIGAMYLPPDRKSDLTCIDNHISSIGSVLSRLSFNDYALLYGDYNQSGLVWNVHGANIPSINVLRSHMSAACCALLDGFDLHSLIQINTVLNRNARMLDFLLVNEAALQQCSTTEAPDSLIELDADHPALETKISMPVPILYEDFEDSSALDFGRADFTAMIQALMEIDWRQLDTFPCVNDAVDYFTDSLNRIISLYVPHRRPILKPAWGNARLRKLKRLRSKALRKYSHNKNVFTKRLFTQASNDYRIYNRHLYKCYTRRMQSRLRRNPKAFWSFVNTKRNEGGLPVEMYFGDRRAHTAQDKSNLLADRFKQVYNNTPATTIEVDTALRETPSDSFDFHIFTVTPEIVENAISKLKQSNVGGPDGIPPSVLKNCCIALIVPLSKLFNCSLLQNVFPDKWKASFMFPVYKKGDKQNAENYRGITSLCACSKVFEIIINDALFARCKNYISCDQHGFYPKRSISTNLMPFISLCLRNMELGAQVDAIYTDLKAAFDRVDHTILLGKLGKLGVTTNMVRWFGSYLTDRKLRVKIGSSTSNCFTNKSGVPQGSNLGPLLFSIFLNDIEFVLPAGNRLFYADDVKMFKIIRCQDDCLQLQQLIDAFSDWCDRNFVTVSIQKCNVISFHRTLKPYLYDYKIKDEPLDRVVTVRDLGITLDSSLTFKLHYTDVIARANRQLGFIMKIANEFQDPFCLKALYCSLVRSILEFGSIIWCPYQRVWIMRLETIQKRFVRYALRHLPWNDALNLPPYEHRCQLLGIETLERRRSIAQAMFVAKVLLGETDSPTILAELQVYAPERPLRTRSFLHLPARVANYGLHDPVRFVSARFNEHYEFFDFNFSSQSFRRRITRMVRE